MHKKITSAWKLKRQKNKQKILHIHNTRSKPYNNPILEKMIIKEADETLFDITLLRDKSEYLEKENKQIKENIIKKHKSSRKNTKRNIIKK